MDISGLREIYDREIRISANHIDLRKEVFPHIIRAVNLADKEGYIPYSRLGAENADAVIEEQIAYFSSLNYEFEWKYYSYDTPADLKERLEARGFAIEEDEYIMVLEIEQAPPRLLQPATRDIRKILDPDLVPVVQQVLDEVYQTRFEWLTPFLLKRLRDYPDAIDIFIAYQEDTPVCAGWTVYPQDTTFAGLWGGSTLPMYRNQGFYTALVAARLQEARKRGVRFINVDAGNKSKPILEKLGFQQIAISNPCKWVPPAKLEQANKEG